MKTAVTWIVDFIKARPYVVIALLWIPAFVWYGALNGAQTAETSHIIESPLDYAIPLCEVFAIPYVLWYLYVFLASIYTLWNSKKDFIHLCCLIFVGLYTSLIICTVYPSWFLLRPDSSVLGSGLCAWIIRGLWEVDNPAVIFPSMHALIACLVAVALCRADCMRGKTGWKIAIVIFAALVCASTVLIKQHSINDVFAALVLVVPCALLVYCVIYPKRRWKRDAGAPAFPLKSDFSERLPR